jgi:hypothetical protein
VTEGKYRQETIMLKDYLNEGRAESGTITKELLEEVNEAKLGTGG